MDSVETGSYEAVVTQALSLPPLYKVRLVERLMASIEKEMAKPVVKRPLASWRGLCADLGEAPSAADIQQSRREEWAAFPRDDI